MARRSNFDLPRRIEKGIACWGSRDADRAERPSKSHKTNGKRSMNGNTLSSRKHAGCGNAHGIRVIATLFATIVLLLGGATNALADDDGAADAKSAGNRGSGEVTVVAQLAWDDSDNVDGSRPATARLQLFCNGAPVDGAFVDLDGTRDQHAGAHSETASWTASFTGLDARDDASGATNDYAVREVVQNEEGEWVEGAPAGYDAAVDRQAASDSSTSASFQITNRHQPATASLVVLNRWVDADNAYGKRAPVALRVYRVDTAGSTADTVKLVAVDVPVGAVQIGNGEEAFEMCAQWDGLPVYEFVTDGSGALERRKVQYTVQEETVPGYTVGYQASPADGRAGADIEQVVADAAELPAVDYRYLRSDETNTVTLTPGDAPSAVLVTNAIESASVPVTVVWDDKGNAGNARPENVTLHLYADGALLEDVLILSGANADPADDSKWVGAFAGLPSFSVNEDGGATRIVYTVSEDEVAGGYASSLAGNQDAGFVITNALPSGAETLSAAQLAWLDAHRGCLLAVSLLNPGAAQPVNAPAEGAEADGQPVAADGEDAAPQDEAENAEQPADDGTVEEEYYDSDEPEEWDEGEFVEGEFVEEEPTESVDEGAEAANGQEPSPGLAQKAQGLGDAAVNLVAEAREGGAVGEAVAAGSLIAVSESQGRDESSQEDAHASETTSVTVRTQWADFDDDDRARPENVTLWLLKNGAVYRGPVEVEEDEAYTWNDLPKYDDGKLIEYTVSEDAPSGYTTQMVERDGENDFMIVNTYNQGVSILAGLTWKDKAGNDIEPGSGVHTPAVAIELVKRSGDSERVVSRFAVPDFADASEADVVFSENGLVSYEDGEQVRYLVRGSSDPALYKQLADPGPMAIDGIMAYTLTNQLLVDGYDPSQPVGEDAVAADTVMVTYVDGLEPAGQQLKAAYRVEAADLLADALAAPAGSVMAVACVVEAGADAAGAAEAPAVTEQPVAGDEAADGEAEEEWAGEDGGFSEEDDLFAQADLTPGVVPADPAHPGYTFLGWSRTDEDGGVILMAAQYAEDDDEREIAVSYVDGMNDGEVLKSETVPADKWQTVEAPEAPEHEGVEFTGWAAPVADDAGNRIYMARYEDAAESDGEVVEAAPVDEDSAMTKATPPAKAGDIPLPTTGDHTLDMVIIICMIALISAATMFTARINHRLTVLVAEKEGREPPLDVREVFEMIGAKRAENQKHSDEHVSFRERLADVVPARINRGKSEYVNDAVGDTFDAWRHRNEGSFKIPRGSDRADTDDRA